MDVGANRAVGPQLLSGGAEFPAVPFVVRVSVTLPFGVTTVSVTDPLITEAPGTAELSVTVQLPVAATVRHGLPVMVPGPEATLALTDVPAGAFTKPVPG